MAAARQPKGVPVGGQFAAAYRADPGLRLNPAGPIGSKLAKAKTALAADRTAWSTKREALRKEELARDKQRRRLAGVQAATLILDQFPSADVLSYTRNEVTGTTDLVEIRDDRDGILYTRDDLDGPVPRAYREEEGQRRAAALDAVRHLRGTSLPPEHAAQGITVDGRHEQLHLATALEDGIEVLEGEDLPGATRRVHDSRRQLAEAINAVDESLLNAAMVHARQIHPDAKEMRLRENRARPGHLETSSLTTAEGEVIRDDGSYESWAFNTVEGSDPADIYDAVANVSQHSKIWDTDPRCEYDHRTREYIIYLDGRRRSEL
jgi:hypothetical protein